MPNSSSSVRGLTRVIRLERPDEPCEHMMRRVDRDEVAAISRHLVGELRPGRDTRPAR